MTIYQLLCLLGVPGFIGTCFAAIILQAKKVKAISLGVQALLRSQMRRDCDYYKRLGYAPLYAKDDFENNWKQYEALGANGVMQNVHDEFMQLPSIPPSATGSASQQTNN